MNDLPYTTLVWLTYHLAATFGAGLPLVILIWAALKREASMTRLLCIYWKVASLMGISILLLTDQRAIGYVITFLSPLLMITSVWFWIDLNEELADLPPWRPLPLTIRVWRWSLTTFGVIYASLSFYSLNCYKSLGGNYCLSWVEIPRKIHSILEIIFKFLFGAQWSEPIAAFVGYVALAGYIIGLLQWLLIRFPKQGRIAGDF